MYKFLIDEGISSELLNEVQKFNENNVVDERVVERIVLPRYKYYGVEIWEKAIVAMLEGYHLLLTGPKATGKNVLAENLAYLFRRPLWNISLNINSDSDTLIGSDTFKNGEVVLKEGPIYEAAKYGGFAVFDEVNMAKNEALSVVHSALDYRRIIDVPGYGKMKLDNATRFIGTMNYGYIGTRELNEALVSRFLVIDMPTISPENLKKILRSEFDLKEEYIEIFVRLFLDLQEKSLNSEISSKPIDLRGMLSAISLMRRGLPIYSALEMGIVNKSFDIYEREIAMDVISTLFSSKLYPEELFNG